MSDPIGALCIIVSFVVGMRWFMLKVRKELDEIDRQPSA